MLTEKESEGKGLILFIEGDCSIYEVKELKLKLGEYLDSSKGAEVDLSKVTKIDSAGFQLLAAFKQELEKSGRNINYINPSSVVKDLFGLYGLEI